MYEFRQPKDCEPRFGPSYRRLLWWPCGRPWPPVNCYYNGGCALHLPCCGGHV